MHSAALVASDGSIDWLCFPRFDSPSVFAAILDDKKGGTFRVGPVGEYRREHYYLPDSNVLVTNHTTDSGAVSLTDFMPLGDDVTHCDHEVVRILRCQSGRVDMEALFQPRLDYARNRTEVTAEGRRAVARPHEIDAQHAEARGRDEPAPRGEMPVFRVALIAWRCAVCSARASRS